MATYSVAEEAGTLEVKLVAQTGAGAATPDASASVSFSTMELDPLEAVVDRDYLAVNTTNGTPTLDLSTGNATRSSSYTSISSDNLAPKFSYTITRVDQDQAGIMMPAGFTDSDVGHLRPDRDDPVYGDVRYPCGGGHRRRDSAPAFPPCERGWYDSGEQEPGLRVGLGNGAADLRVRGAVGR